MDTVNGKINRRSPRVVKIVTSAALILLVLLSVTAAFLYGDKIRTLNTLDKVDEFPLYSMIYYGDYGFADFLERGATSDEEIEDFVTRKLLFGLEFNLQDGAGYGCSAFTAATQDGERIFGRNFDFDYTPALFLYTDPPDAYASVSMVSLSFAGYSADDLPDDSWRNRFMALAAPYLPFDGMNERGVAMALLSVPFADPGKDPDKVTLNTTTVIRLVLDYAASVDEAIALLEDYNIYFSADIANHYLIADASGDSAVIEYLDGGMNIVRGDEAWQVVTNFILSHPDQSGSGHDRYEIAFNALQNTGGVLSEAAAMHVLEFVSIPTTLWSLVYNLDSGETRLAMGMKYDQVYTFLFE